MGRKSKSVVTELNSGDASESIPSPAPIFSTDDLVRLTGITKPTLNRWVNDQLLHPKNGGIGRHIEYAMTDARAVVAGMHFRDAGFDAGWVAASVRLLADLGRNILVEIKAGRTWIAPGTFVVGDGKRTYIPGKMTEPPDPEHLAEAQAQLIVRLDMRVIVERFSASIQKLSEERRRDEKKFLAKKPTKVKRTKKVAAEK